VQWYILFRILDGESSTESNFHPKLNILSSEKGKKKKRSKPNLVTGHEGLLRLPHFPYSQLADGSEVVHLTRQPHLYLPGRFLVLISVRG
jgi:hypothetical protein